jgi:hypothetical protein
VTSRERNRAPLSRRGFIGAAGAPASPLPRWPGDLEDNMIRVQTALTVRRLRKVPLLRGLTATDGLRIVGGHYNLDTGVVQVIA